MIFSTFSNIVVIILCLGVLVQTSRMILAFQIFRKSDIGQTVAALDNATVRATAALSELKHMLATEAAANNRGLSAAEALRDELSIMVDVGNSVAERIMEAAATVAPAAGGDAPDIVAADMAEVLPASAATQVSKTAARARLSRGGKPTRRAAKPPAPEVAVRSAGVH